ncbi:MAG TPA: class I SAM-dependent methyltransferase [Methanosarcina sp.]|jgi:SAM-dependent methyltransferase
MDKSDIHKLTNSQTGSMKNHFLAWDREYSHLKWGGPAPVQNIQVQLLSGSRILDAGSGNGRYLGELARHYSAIGIDVSLTALKGSRTQLARSERFAEHIGANISNLPFKSQIFDGILCYGVLQHLFNEERESAVKEFNHVLKKGGLIFFEAFGCEDMRCGGKTSIPFEERTFARQNGIIYHYFTKDEVETLFKEFKLIEIENIIKEKNFKGAVYRRHLVRGIFQKL